MGNKNTSEVILKYTDKFTTGFQKTIQQIQGGTLISKKAIRELDQVSTQMIKTGAMVFTPLALGMKSTLQEAMNIENAYAKVATIADESQKPMLDVQNEMIATSKQFGKSITDVSDAYYQVISATVDTANAYKYVDVATKMSIGGFTDEVSAVNGLTTAMAAYKKMGYDVARVGDIMAMTQVKGKTTIGELAEVMGQVVPYTSQMGLSFEDLGASMAVLTSNGLNTAMAATTFKNSLNSILKPSSTAIKMFEKYGIKYGSNALNGGSFGDYLESIKKSIGLSESAQKELQELSKNANITDEELTDFYTRSGVNADALVQMFKNIRGATAMLSLTGSMDKYQDFRMAMNEENSQGTLEKQYETMTNTLSHQMGIFTNEVKLAMGHFGEQLVPYVKDIMATVKPYLDTISQMDEEQARKVADIAVKVLGISGGMIVVGTISKGIVNISKTINWIWKIGTDILKWSTDISKIATTIGSVSATVASILGVATTIASGFGVFTLISEFINDIKEHGLGYALTNDKTSAVQGNSRKDSYGASTSFSLIPDENGNKYAGFNPAVSVAANEGGIIPNETNTYSISIDNINIPGTIDAADFVKGLIDTARNMGKYGD